MLLAPCGVLDFLCLDSFSLKNFMSYCCDARFRMALIRYAMAIAAKITAVTTQVA